MQNGAKFSISRQLLKCTTEDTKLEIGLTGKLFSHDFLKYRCLATNPGSSPHENSSGSTL
jgi:hypothetical protein